MKIHEYQAKELLEQFNIPIQGGITISAEAEAASALDEVENKYKTKQFVIKAQIHAGGRGNQWVPFVLTQRPAILYINSNSSRTIM